MTPETLRKWLRRDQVDSGRRPGVTTSERERIRQLERENRELRRANEILKAASVFFAFMRTVSLSGELARFFAARLRPWPFPDMPLARRHGPAGMTS